MAKKKHLAQITLLVAVLAVGATGAAESDLVLLEKLIRIPSVSSNIVEVNKAVDFLDGELGRDGLYRQIETMPDGRRVLFAANESTKRPDILLSAHLDVVPEKDPSQFFGSDEEIGGMSTAFMLDKGYGAAKMVIVLDSEQFAITTRQKGLARYVIEADAPPTHAGMVKGAPPNAVRELILSYEAAAAEIPDFEDGTWRDVMMLERVSGTREHAEMEISVRCARKGGFESIENLLRNKFKRDLRCLRKGEAVLLDETQPYLVAFRERMRRAWPDRKVDFYHLNSSTDARHLQRLNLPMLILGVDARGAHTATEYVEIPSLDEYAVLIESYLMDEFGN